MSGLLGVLASELVTQTLQSFQEKDYLFEVGLLFKIVPAKIGVFRLYLSTAFVTSHCASVLTGSVKMKILEGKLLPAYTHIPKYVAGSIKC